jgi:multidrug efflux pump subunit AcrA (membrane-fusion protein)
MKKKIFIIILIILLVGAAFFVGRQVGLNTEDSKTKTVITEETVGTQDLKKTLTASGQVSAKTTEELDLTTTKYFEAMCVEEDDTVLEGENILEYTDGTYLTAPYDLVVKSFDVPDAESKCTSSNYIEVSDLTTLQTTIQVSENEIGEVAKDQEVEITLTADETKTYTGTITKIDSVGSYSSSGSTFTATIEFENDGNVKLGMSLSCTVILEEEKDAVCIPIEAVYENSNGEEYVNKINSDGTIEETIIETGIADDSYVQVLSGLALDDKVQIITETTESTSSSSDSSSSLSGFGKGMNGDNSNFGGGDMPSGDMMQNGGDNMKGGKGDFSSGNGGGDMPSGGMPTGK